ncbi:MAG TPA: hypothetical protein VF190_05770 [Rhodothermales bacterium]
MNLADAQRTAREDAKIRAAVACSQKKARPGAGITDDPDCEVELFRLVRDADAFFKGRKEMLEADGFAVTYGTVSRGLLILECDDAAVSMSLVKRRERIKLPPTKDPPNEGSTI